jgi:hypothetical protein
MLKNNWVMASNVRIIFVKKRFITEYSGKIINFVLI